VQKLNVSCTDIAETKLNGYSTFAVVPDGPKEGWTESQLGDERRTQIVEYLDTFKFSDGSSPISWVEVQYGGSLQDSPDLGTKVLRHSADF
jgi:hypothetical protein